MHEPVNPFTPQEPPEFNFLIFFFGVLALLLFMIFAFKDIVKAEPIQLMASWYSCESLKKEGTWKYSKGVMANGKMFKDEAFTCATRLYPLGTTLLVKSLYSEKSVEVRVTDRISKRFGKTRIDLSKFAFVQIADLRQGLVPVTVEQL